MKKEDKNSPQIQTNNKQTPDEKTLKQNDNIKDYDRAWEDDRL